MPRVILASSHNAANVLTREFRVTRRTSRPSWIASTWTCSALASRTTSRRGVAQSRLGIPPERTVVAYLGLFAPYQGTDLLLEAAQIIRGVRKDVHF